MANVMDRQGQLLMLKLMCRNCGITDIAEIMECSPVTVRRYLGRFGQALRSTHDRLVQNLKNTTRIQVDETWSYVWGRTDKIVRWDKAPPKAGDAYTWTAFDPDNKLFVTWLVGGQGLRFAKPFIRDLASRLTGEVRVLITSDANKAYDKAIEKAFGANADYVKIKKVLKEDWDPEIRKRTVVVVAMHKQPMQQTNVNLRLASTSLAERHHATMRNFMSRFNRQSYRFSKRFENHVFAQSIYAVYYNFCKPHRGFKGKERHFTPAIKAGIVDRVWSFDDLLREVDTYWEHKDRQPALKIVETLPPPFTPLQRGVASTKPYFVMLSLAKHWAKVHAGKCNNCHHGLGRKGGSALSQWYAFDSLEDARAAAALVADDWSECSMCIRGFYRTMKQPA